MFLTVVSPALSQGIKKVCFGCSVFMNHNQDVIIQSLGPWMSEHLFSLQRGLMRAEISEPQLQTGPIHHRGLGGGGEEQGSQKRKVDRKPRLRLRWR